MEWSIEETPKHDEEDWEIHSSEKCLGGYWPTTSMAIGLKYMICNGKLKKLILFILRGGDLGRENISATSKYFKNIWKEEVNILRKKQQK